MIKLIEIPEYNEKADVHRIIVYDLSLSLVKTVTYV